MSIIKRNAYMLGKHNHKNAYDWWWHSFSAKNLNTGELESFFIEYYVINPGLGGDEPILGQLPGKPCIPSYGMIKAGKWGKGKAQINNFWGINDFKASRRILDVKIGDNIVGEKELTGRVSLSKEELDTHPEYMSDSGEMSWDLKAEKELSYSVGYGASFPFRLSRLFSMYWHVQGMKVRYSGTIVFNGQEYTVSPEDSFGYQDKNWGRDYTNPWIWLNCNSFRDENGVLLENTSLDIGGGKPKVAGIPIGEKVLGAFCYEGVFLEFNFAKIFFQKQNWNCHIDNEKVYWDIEVSNRTHTLSLSFSCIKDGMIKVNYENPAGKKFHNELWNGGEAKGTAVLKERKNGKILCQLTGDHGGCEYGVY